MPQHLLVWRKLPIVGMIHYNQSLSVRFAKHYGASLALLAVGATTGARPIVEANTSLLAESGRGQSWRMVQRADGEWRTSEPRRSLGRWENHFEIH